MLGRVEEVDEEVPIAMPVIEVLRRSRGRAFELWGAEVDNEAIAPGRRLLVDAVFAAQ